MSDDAVKKLLETLTSEQKADLIDKILNSNVKDDAVQTEHGPIDSESKSNVNEDFTVNRSNDVFERRKTPVKAKKNKWVDDGEGKDLDFDPEKFERMGRTSRNRGKTKKQTIECHVCGKTFSIHPSLIHGEFIRCNKCTGR